MFKKFKSFDKGKELEHLIALYVVGALFQGLALAFVVPFVVALWNKDPKLMIWAFAVAGSGLVAVIADGYSRVMSFKVSVYTVCDTLLAKLAKHLLALPLGFFNTERNARILTAFTRDINLLSQFASMTLPAIIRGFLVPAVLMFAAFIFSWQIALLMLVTIIPIVLLWRLMIKTSAKGAERKGAKAVIASERIMEYARLQPLMRACGKVAEGWEPLTTALSEEHAEVKKSMQSDARIAFAYTAVVYVAMGIIMVAGLALVGADLLSSLIYIGLMLVMVRFLEPLSEAQIMGSAFTSAEESLNNIYSFFETPALPSAKTEVAITSHEIELKDVTFAYRKDHPVLKHVSATLPAHKISALVGPSGAGKSSILRLIARFWDVQAGALCIGGVDVKKIPTEQLMSMISMVFQDTYLFDTSIRENIKLAKPNASDEEVQKAAEAAHLMPVIEGLPHGWDTQVGSGGAKLSGGERQRVAIARAFLKDAPILLLDEITSALDGENEEAISRSIELLSQGRTVVVVAHRLSSIQNADQVLVIAPPAVDAAQAQPNALPSTIVQKGSPQELAKEEGIFARFMRDSRSDTQWRVGK